MLDRSRLPDIIRKVGMDVTARQRLSIGFTTEFVMPLDNWRGLFSRTGISGVPDKPGVYALYQNGKCTYYGSSTVSIRGRLQDHLSGEEGQCTQAADSFNYETTPDPVARERQLILEFVAQHRRLPRCNSNVP